MNKRIITMVAIATLLTALVAGCAPQPVNNGFQDTFDAFERAAKLFANAENGQVYPITVAVHNIQQTGSVITAIVDVEQQLTPTIDAQVLLAQLWLKQNEPYLEQWQINNVQAWIDRRLAQQTPNTGTSTVHWTYKIMSTSAEDAIAGNFAVWYWTNIDKVPVGYITNWEPVVLVHWGGFSPEDVYRQIFELVRVNR